MNDLIIVPPNTIHKVRTMMNQSALYQLARYCHDNDIRFMQALCNISRGADPFYMENSELERKIIEYIKRQKE